MGFRTCALRSARSRGAQRAVPVGGTAGDMAALAGQWEGSYSSASTGRSGSISFTLSAGNDSAFGDVIMIPRGWGRDRKSTRLNSSHSQISYAVFCLKKKKK